MSTICMAENQIEGLQIALHTKGKRDCLPESEIAPQLFYSVLTLQAELCLMEDRGADRPPWRAPPHPLLHPPPPPPPRNLRSSQGGQRVAGPPNPGRS